MNYNRGDIVLLPFPFITQHGARQKARPALVISDHSINRRYGDIVLVGITSKRIDDIAETEFLIDEKSPEFKISGLKKSSVVRCEYIMTAPPKLVARKLGSLPSNLMKQIDGILKTSLGL